MYFSNKTIVVTGAASGIGRELAGLFVREGGLVAGIDIDPHGLGNTRADLGEGFVPFECDLTDRDMLQATVQRILDRFPSVDVLVNNAGIVVGKPFVEHTNAEIDRVFQVNALAPMMLTRELLPSMLRRNEGHVVTIASAGGLVATTGMAAYAASKFAAVGFDEALRLELRKAGSAVRTTVVCPFYINTGMFEGVRTRVPWLLPILEPDVVARRIVKAIRRKRRRVIMPWFVYTLFPFRLLPTSWFDHLLDLFGITSTMDAFQGRSRPPEPPR